MKKAKKFTKDQLIIVVMGLAVVLLFVFCMNAFETDNVPEAGTTAPVQTAVQQELESTESTTVPAPSDTTAVTETVKPTATTAAPSVDETEEILRVVFDSVNKLKSDEANFTGHKVQNINMKLVDSSVPAVNNIVNGVLDAFIKEEILDYDFTNGVSPNPEGEGTVRANSTFPPGDLPFTLTRDGVAKAEKHTDGTNTTYTVVIVAESSTLENPRPPHHNSAADTLDLSSVEIPIITLTRVDFDYSGATVSVTLNQDGEIVGYYEHLPISGTGEGYGLGITGFGTIEGYLEEEWDITWK